MLGSHVSGANMIRFRYHHQSTPTVSVAGSFSGWQPVPMGRLEDGWWGLDIGPMPPGNIYYKFQTPQGWSHDQFNFRRTQDGQNSLLNVGGTCGHLLKRSFFTPALGREKNYVIYLPPQYTLEEDRRFPYLILMGGLFEEASGWVDNASVHERLDRLIISRAIDPMVVVMPDKDEAVYHQEMWDAYFSFLSRDLTGHVDAEYRTLPLRAAEGLSLAGVWALRLAALAPEAYGSAGSLSGQMDEKVRSLFQRNLPLLRARGTRISVACGTGEGEVVPNNGAFAEYLNGLGIHCEFRVNEGIHRWSLWQNQIEDSLKFHDYSFKQTS